MEWLLRCRAWCTGYIHGCPENCLQLCISMWWGISLLYADSYRQIMPSSNSDRMQLRFFFHMFISLPFMSLIYIYISTPVWLPMRSLILNGTTYILSLSNSRNLGFKGYNATMKVCQYLGCRRYPQVGLWVTWALMRREVKSYVLAANNKDNTYQYWLSITVLHPICIKAYHSVICHPFSQLP